MQKFKSVYFPPADSESSNRCVTLAFGADDKPVFDRVRQLSSLEVRSLLGHSTFPELISAAELADRSINSYCLLRLRASHATVSASQSGAVGLLAIENPLEHELIGTFRAGEGDPLHGWFPYLEGYSPAFVDTVLDRYSPHATSVLDPFGGVGTTPIQATRRGLRAYYCEINPFLQFLVELKSATLRLPLGVRASVSDALSRLSSQLVTDTKEVQRNAYLAETYKRSFGKSEFFDRGNFDHILRLRELCDRRKSEDPLVGKLFELAILASLVSSSKLVRRGDLRFRNEAESVAPIPRIVAAVAKKLVSIATSLKELDQIRSAPTLLCGDARALAKAPITQVDSIVTSPPYLNGTNYFRNTKIELWFLRVITSGVDLSYFRKKTVTAGINDVTVDKTRGRLRPEAKEIVEKLRRHSYDRRIPDMAASYFADMADVFAAMVSHLKTGGVAALDIGDSCYDGVHVKTDDILSEIATTYGLRLAERTILRQRRSRSGKTLSQTLLVFEKETGKPTSNKLAVRESEAWAAEWALFKKTLPHKSGSYRKRNWGHANHSLCSYQGKMKPALAHFLVKTFVPNGGTLLDPFAGAGTIPFEAALLGAKTYAIELSPAASAISHAKIGRTTEAGCQLVLTNLGDYIKRNSVRNEDIDSAAHISFNKPLTSYFAQHTFKEILKARRYFLENPPTSPDAALVFSSLLHILHGNRPYALSRRSHPITPFAPTGPFAERALMPRLQTKVNRVIGVQRPQEFVEGTVFQRDSTEWWPHEIERLDAVITSPPFFDSTRFHLGNWMRLWFAGWDFADFRTRPLLFIDERQKKTFDVYEPIFRQARERLNTGGVFVMHLGKSRKCDMADAISRVARTWFRVADVFSESVEDCESHGIRDKGTVTTHQFLVLC